MEFRRIVDPQQIGGVPCLRRLRIPVATVVGMVADGMSEKDILQAYPDLELEVRDYGLQEAADVVIFERAARENGASSSRRTPTSVTEALDVGSVVVFEKARVRLRSLPIAGEE